MTKGVICSGNTRLFGCLGVTGTDNMHPACLEGSGINSMTVCASIRHALANAGHFHASHCPSTNHLQ